VWALLYSLNLKTRVPSEASVITRVFIWFAQYQAQKPTVHSLRVAHSTDWKHLTRVLWQLEWRSHRARLLFKQSRTVTFNSAPRWSSRRNVQLHFNRMSKLRMLLLQCCVDSAVSKCSALLPRSENNRRLTWKCNLFLLNWIIDQIKNYGLESGVVAVISRSRHLWGESKKNNNSLYPIGCFFRSISFAY